jgi:hypothetical protein
MTTEQIAAVAAGLIALIPEVTVKVILASSDKPMTSGQIAKLAGTGTGASVVHIMKTSGFHEVFSANVQQYLWVLNDLGLAVANHLRKNARDPNA